MTEPPITRFYDLNCLSEAGYETSFDLGRPELAALAEWADVVAVNSFHATVSMKRLSPSRFAYAARLEAQIVQNCTVSLEPISSNISMDFARTLHLVAQARKTADFSGELSPAAGDEDVPEEIDSPRFDLAAPLLEEFVLAIDPYPRAPGVSLELPAEDDAKPENPFAVLKGLKSGG